MNKEIMDATEALRDTVRASKEYAEYQRCRKQVEEDPELLSAVEEYRQRAFRFQNSDDIPDRDAERAALVDMMNRLRRSPAADAYFRSEVRMCRILQHTADMVLDPLDLHTEVTDV